jgi:hypothetical protein
MGGNLQEYGVSWCDFTGNPVLVLVEGILGIAFWLRIAKIVEPVLGHSKAVNTIANHTYGIMTHHIMGFMIVKTGFAVIAKYTPLFQDFDFYVYKNFIWYYYLPAGASQTTILYIVLAVIFSIAVDKAAKAAVAALKHKWRI